ncbi:MAG: sensor histidine kinase [Alphaproteobacteria bacterium]
MTVPARADLRALARCDRPVLVSGTGSIETARIFANRAALLALRAPPGDGIAEEPGYPGAAEAPEWTLLDAATVADLGAAARHFLPPYPAGAERFALALDRPAGPVRWNLTAWPVEASDEAKCVVAVAADDGPPPADGADGTLIETLEDVAAIGHVWSEPGTGRLSLSPGAARVWGLPPGQSGRTLGDLLALVHPDDFPDVLESEAQGSVRRREFRILRSDGAFGTVERSSRAVGDVVAGGTRILHVDRDVTQLRQLEQALVEASAARDSAGRSQAEFLALMSHELRTPLNAVMGFAQVMTGEMFGPLGERYLDYSREIEASAQSLLQTINDILDLSRIESARAQIARERLDLGRLVDESSFMLTEPATEKRVAISRDIEPGVRIWGEKRSIRQLTLNLVGNAVKFCDPGGHVRVAVWSREDGAAFLSVTDDGIGIPEEEIAIVQKPFVQASNAVARAAAGSGLGLAIVRALVDMHAGRLDIRSRLGEGTTVTVTFPPALGPAWPDGA